MNQRIRSARGAAIIETAFTLPILLLVSVGIFEFGRAYETWQVLTNAAREGARVAILPNPAPGAADARVRSYLQLGGLTYDNSVGVNISNTTVSMGASGNASASQVTVSYPFTFMVLQPVAQLVVSGTSTGSPITLTASSVMRNETQF
jgi:Flp pilus assembly protein TadG